MHLMTGEFYTRNINMDNLVNHIYGIKLVMELKEIHLGMIV